MFAFCVLHLIYIRKQKELPKEFFLRICKCFIYAILVTLTAFGPFGESALSKDNVSPTFSSLKLTPFNSLPWKKRSFSSPSTVMKPKPFSLSVLIIPCIVLKLVCKCSQVLSGSDASLINSTSSY